MPQVISFDNYLPPARFDDLPWKQVLVEEADTAEGVWAVIDTLTLSPVDDDPSDPALRSFTTEAASDEAGLWYRVTFLDEDGDTSQPSTPVRNAVTSAYFTVDQLKAQLDIPANSEQFDEDLERAVGAAADTINGHCRRRFTKDTVDVERSYYLDGSGLVEIDDLAEMTSVEIDGELVDAADYALEPLNAAADSRPFTHVRLDTTSAGTLLTVTGKFGWPAIPARVPMAASILSARLFKRRETPLGLVSFGEAQPLRLELTDPDVAALLDRLQRGSAIRSVQLG